MANSNILEIPQIQPFQFSSDSKGVDNTVNLFRGEVNFYIPLVSLTGRNGLDLQVSALYRSNVYEQVKTRNLSAPTSILGLGWDLPSDRIEVDAQGTGDEDNKYFFVHNDIRSRLYRNNQLWVRGVLDKNYIKDLDSQNFSKALYTALQNEGLRIDASSTITILLKGTQWIISDLVHEFDLNLQLTSEGKIQVFDGGKSYELQGYDFSRIRYYARYEKWEITYTNGITSSFGGKVTVTDQIKSSVNQTIQWGVRVGNWKGSGMVTHSSVDPTQRIQQQYAKAWNFASSQTIWNDRIEFEYDQVIQFLGFNGLPYTKASYLKKITDVFGRTVNFSYLEKTFDQSSIQSPREFADPNKLIPDNLPDAFQSCYQTRYLDAIQVMNDNGSLLYQLSFRYILERYTETCNTKVYGDTFKRTLTTIEKLLGTGHTFPNIDLTYNSVANKAPGSLKSITYAEGCTISYDYSRKELINCSRDLTIDNPVKGSTPRVWFGDNFSVVTWYTENLLNFEIYTWVGRWQKWVPEKSAINDFIDLSTFKCLIQQDFFVLYYTDGNNYTVRTFHKDSRIVGSWIENGKNPIILQTDECTVTGGENYFAVTDQILSTVDIYTWSGLTNSWSKAPLIDYSKPANPAETRLFLSGVNNILILLSYDKLGAPGRKNNLLKLYYLDELGQWKVGDTLKATDIAIEQTDLPENFHWTMLPWSITASYITESLDSCLKYNLSIYQWEATSYKLKEPVTTSLSIEKSAPSGTDTIPFVANCTTDGLLSSGPNLMRFNGEKWLRNDQLKIENPVVDSTIFWFTAGPDFVIKTENSESRILGMIQVFDPNTQSFIWEEKAITIYDSGAQGDRLSEYFPSSSGDFLTWNLDVYERGTSSNWIESLKQPVFSLDKDSDTTTLINQAPNFMVYMVKESNQKDILGTQILTMVNGVIDKTQMIQERFFSLVDKEGHLISDVEGKMPGGLNSFMTYLPLDANFDEASSITLYRYIGQSMKDPIVNYPAHRVSIFDGFQTVETYYNFDHNTAACDYNGFTAKYYKTIVSKGINKANGWSEYHFYNSLDGAGFNNGNLKLSSFLDGMLSQNLIYDASGKLVSYGESEFNVVTSIASKHGSVANSPIWGALVQVKESRQEMDGVKSITLYQYDAFSGNLCNQENLSYNAYGKTQRFRKESTYGFEVYSLLSYSNNLAQIVQTKDIVNTDNLGDTVISGSVTTIRKYPVLHAGSRDLMIPAPFETYNWLGGEWQGNFNFEAWSSGIILPTNWLKTSSITKKSDHGMTLERQAPIGKIQSDLFSLDESVLVATFSNASLDKQEAYYYGFEEYENPGLWKLDSNTPIVDSISQSGKRCLQLLPGTSGSPITLTPENMEHDYIFTCWGKADKMNQNPNAVGWKMEVLSENASPVQVSFLDLGKFDDWNFCFLPIHLKSLGLKKQTIRMTPFNNSGVTVYCDNVGFAPLENPLYASVYEPTFYNITEQLGPFESTVRSVYDAFGRVIGQSNVSDELVRVVSPYLSRQVNGQFSIDEPNYLVNFQPMGDTVIDRFRNNGNYSNYWTTKNPQDWKSEKGSLIHTTIHESLIQFSEPSFKGNYVMHIGFQTESTISYKLGLQIGADLIISWSPSTKYWQLFDLKNNKNLNCRFESAQPEEDWVLAFSKDAVFFLVNGRLAFSYIPDLMVSGAPALFCTDKVRFNNFLIGLDSQVAVQFLDGSGKIRQGQSLEGKKVTVTQTVYDDALLPVVTTMPATLAGGSGLLLSYRADAVLEMDWVTGIMKGAIADKRQEDEGYPYSRKLFEKSPIGRTLEIGAPGKEFAITGSPNTHTVKYVYSCNTVEDPSLPEGQYFKTTRYDQNGNAVYSLRDKLGNQISNVVCANDGSTIKNATFIDYSTIGKKQTDRLPNYYHPPVNSKPENWQRTSVFNTRGQLISTSEPNSGTTTNVYNQDGLLRFIQNPEQADKGIVLYKKYNIENQIIEEGYLKYKWNIEDLQNKATNCPEWPNKEDLAMPQSRFYYNGDGQTLHDLGNLTMIEVMSKTIPGQVETQTRQHFNKAQKIARTDVTILKDGITFTTLNEFDNLGNVKSTTYPSNIKLTNIRDEVGRVSKIIDDAQNELLELTYTAGDQIRTETNKVIKSAPITTVYDYNPQGWLIKAKSPQLTEIINYTKNGYGSTGYFDGTVASKTVQLAVPTNSKVPSEVTYKFKYDETYRLKVAECSIGNLVMENLSLGLSQPVTYDNNGNFIQVNKENYTYKPGSDMVINTDGSARQDFMMDKNGSTISSSPRGITNIIRDVYSGKPNAIQTALKGTMNFVYDENDNRLSKKTNAGTKYYGRDHSGTVMTERNLVNGLTKTCDYLYGPTGLFALRTESGMNAVQKDHLKSPRVLTDNTGKVISAYQYEPFGLLVEKEGNNAELLNYLFGGYELDSETGLYNASARLYDPALRRFYCIDPKLQYASPYLFVGNNPMNLVDPDGEAAWWSILIGAVLGLAVSIVTFGAGTAAVAAATTAANVTLTALGEVVTGVALGAVAGTSGQLVGDAATAGMSGEKYTPEKAMISALTGFAGGVVGAGVGGAVGTGVKTALKASTETVRAVSSGVIGGVAGGIAGSIASEGVTAAMTGQPFFSKETAIGIAIGAIGGAGGGLILSGSQCGWFGAKPQSTDVGIKKFMTSHVDYGDVTTRACAVVSDLQYCDTKQAITDGYGSQNANLSSNGQKKAGVAAINGVGRYVLPLTDSGYTQPMTAKTFTQCLDASHPYLIANIAPSQGIVPLKLSICSLPGSFGSFGQTLGAALGRTTGTGRGFAVSGSSAQGWLSFNG